MKDPPNSEAHKQISKALHHSAKEHIPQTPKYQRKDQITPAAAEIIRQRTTAWREYRAEDAENLTAQLTMQMRKDRRKRLLDMVDKDLDVRDRWMGIRYLNKGYQAIPYTIKDEKGKRVGVGNKAHEAAIFLATAT